MTRADKYRRGSARERLALLSASGEQLEDDYERAERLVLAAIRRTTEAPGWPAELSPPDPWPEAEPGSLLSKVLTAWVQRCPRALVLFFDEIDALRGPSLMSVRRGRLLLSD